MALDFRATREIKTPEMYQEAFQQDPARDAYYRAQTEEAHAQAQERMATSAEARAKQMKAARISQAMANAATPYEAAKQLEQIDPEAAWDLKGKLSDHALKMIQGVTSYQAIPSAWQDIKRYVGDEIPMPTFTSQDEFNVWKREQVLAHATVATYLEQTKPSAQQTEKTREIRVKQPDGSEKIMVVKDEPGQEWTSSPPVATPGSARTREIETIDPKTGKRVRMIVPDEPGQSFPVPPPAAGAGPVDPLVDVYDPVTKTRVWLPRSQAAGKPVGAAGSATSKPATGAQTKVLGFFNRAKQADEDLQQLETTIASMGYLEQERMKRAPNLLQTQTGQSYNQAQRAFTEARLRKDSGAAIPEQEFANDRVTYFAQPGDSASTLAQKARARAAVLASMAFEAGPAVDGFYGDEAPSMIAGYRDRAKGGSTKTTTGGGTTTKTPKVGDTKTFPNGRKGRWDGEGWELVP